jgi:hypothetical protein
MSDRPDANDAYRVSINTGSNVFILSKTDATTVIDILGRAERQEYRPAGAHSHYVIVDMCTCATGSVGITMEPMVPFAVVQQRALGETYRKTKEEAE